MADNIKGITIQIDGETKGLDKALADVNKRSRDLGKELREVETALKFNPGNVELIAQKQQLLTEQVENTTKKLNQLKDAQADVESQFRRGDIGEDKYRKFRREIIKTEDQLRGFETELKQVGSTNNLDEVEKDLEGVKKEADDASGAVDELASALGGVVAGAGIKGTIDKALDVSTLDTDIKLSMDIDPESAESVRRAISDVKAYGIDPGDALEGARRQWALTTDEMLEAGATLEEINATNADIVKQAGALTRSYSGLDFTEVIQETREIAKELNITQQEAIGMADSLIKVGFPPDQLDIIAEYGQQLTRAGYSAEDVQNIIRAGVDTGTWNIDNLLDGLKEGRIRASELGAGLSGALEEALGLLPEDEALKMADTFATWGTAIANGGEQGNAAFSEMAAWLNTLEDETAKNAIGVGIFGTIWEDQGQNIIETITNADNATLSLKDGVDGVSGSIDTLDSDPMVQMQQAMTEIMFALRPVLQVIADVVSKIATWMAENPKLAATVMAVVTAVGILYGIIVALTPIFLSMSTLAPILGAAFAALTGPVGLVIAAVAGLIAIVVALKNDWGGIATFFSDLWSTITGTFSEQTEALRAMLANLWQNISDTLRPFWEGISTFFSGIFEQISQTVSTVWDNIVAYFGNVWEIIKNIFVGAFAAILLIVTGRFTEAWELIKEVMANIVNAVKENLALVVDSFFQILNTVLNIFGDLKDGALGAFNGMLDGIKSIIQTVIDFLKDIDLMQIGKDMIQGLINGVTSMGGALLDGIGGLVDGAIEGAKNILDINSPSRVFEQIGTYTGEGLEKGLINMGGRVAKASADMAASTTDIEANAPQITQQPQRNNNNDDTRNQGGDVIINIQNMQVRSDEDIKRISRELKRQIDRSNKGKGVS